MSFSSPYSPILIDFQPAVQSAEGNNLQPPSSIWLRIVPPSAPRRGAIQSFPEPIVVQVPSNGMLRLQLMCSNVFLEPGRYRVEYHRAAADSTPSFRRHFHSEDWLVPPVLDPISLRLVHSAAGDFVDVPVWAVLSTPFPAGEYKVVNSHILWLSGGPTVGEQYDIVIQPGLTRDRIIWPRPAPLPTMDFHIPAPPFSATLC